MRTGSRVFARDDKKQGREDIKQGREDIKYDRDDKGFMEGPTSSGVMNRRVMPTLVTATPKRQSRYSFDAVGEYPQKLSQKNTIIRKIRI